MKTNLTRSLIFAAVALTGAAAAYGQSKVAADVPFAFRAAGVDFDGGTYYISQYGHSGAGTLMVVNDETGYTKFVATLAPADNTEDARPRLVFRCGDESGCALSEVSLANGRVWKLRVPHMKPSEMERIAVIYFERKQAE